MGELPPGKQRNGRGDREHEEQHRRLLADRVAGALHAEVVFAAAPMNQIGTKQSEARAAPAGPAMV